MRQRLVIPFAFVAVVLLVAFVAPFSGAEERSAGASSAVPRVQVTSRPAIGPRPLAIGTLTYDNNVPFSRSPIDGGTVGNLFTTGVLDPHNIDAVSFRIAGNWATSMVMTVWDQNPASFVVLNRQLVSGLPNGTVGPVTGATHMANVSPPIAGHSGPFVAGMRNTDYAPCAGNAALNSTCDGVALTAGGVNPGNGFHAHRVPFNSTSFVPTINTVAGAGTSLGTINAIFRVTGDNLPVELMRFGAE